MNFLTEELQSLDSRSLRRSLRVVSEAGAARVTIDGRSLWNFSSNNYLGFARHPRVIEAVKEVLAHWGAGATSSRLISGNTIIHQDLESALAAFLRRDAALLFPAGYMANVGVLTTLAGPGDAVVMDRQCHASLIDAARLSGARLLVYRHADVRSAERALERASSFRRRLLVTESLFSMDGDFAPCADLAALATSYGAISVIDEAHAIGVWGEQGAGFGTGDIIVGTLSKSLGSQGGFVAGSRDLIAALVNKARSFIFTTGLSPLSVAAAQAALSLIQEDSAPRLRVRALSARLRDGLRAGGWDILGSQSQIVPVRLGDPAAALALAAQLYEAGIFAPAIRPPTVHAGQCRVRFSVTAEHDERDIDLLLAVMKDVPSPARGEGDSK